MHLDDRAADRQADAEPVGLGRVEGLEDPIDGRHVDTGAGIPHEQVHAVAVGARDHPDPGVAAGGGAGLNGVEREVQDDLPQLQVIAVHDRQVGLELGDDRHTGQRRLVREEADDVVRHRVDVHRRPVEVVFLEQTPHALNHFAGAPVLLDDLLEDLPDLGRVRMRCRDQPASGLRVAEDGGQRLVQLVCDGGPEFADPRHHVAVRELAEVPVHVGLGTAPRRDLLVRDDGAALGALQPADAKLGPVPACGVVPAVVGGGLDAGPVGHRSNRHLDAAGAPHRLSLHRGGERYAGGGAHDRIQTLGGDGIPRSVRGKHDAASVHHRHVRSDRRHHGSGDGIGRVRATATIAGRARGRGAAPVLEEQDRDDHGLEHHHDHDGDWQHSQRHVVTHTEGRAGIDTHRSWRAQGTAAER